MKKFLVVFAIVAAFTCGALWHAPQPVEAAYYSQALGAPIKNRIINGDMAIWQRAINFVGITSGNYAADRFSYIKVNTTAVHNIAQATDVPTFAQAGRKYNYSAQMLCTTADSGVFQATDLITFRQSIEGYNIYDILGNGYNKGLTLSFWIKAGKTGTMGVRIAGVSGAANPSYVREVSILTTGWEYKTLTITAAPSTGTWDTTNGVGLYVDFCLMGGSTYQTTANAWQAGNYYTTSNQTNFVTATDATCYVFFTGIQLTAGTNPTEFEDRTIGQELRFCQRYYCKSFPMTQDPDNAARAFGSTVYTAYTGNEATSSRIFFPVEMRSASPTFTFYRSNAGSTNGRWQWYRFGVAAWTDDGQVTVAGSIDSRGFNVPVLATGLVTAGQSYLQLGDWAADNEL